jgi:hypothetical protein
MATTVQQPYNMFAAPKLKRPVQVYDPTKSVQENMAGNGAPSAQNIVSAYQTPQAQVQVQQPVAVKQQPGNQTQPVLDSNSSSAGMDYLNSLYTSPQEEERLRKASVMNPRILAIGDAIRHIGNIANTVNYAPAQQFNSPVAEEQARYERGKALRDRANQQFYTYQQQKAAQDAKERQLEAERAAKERQFRYTAAKDAALLAEQKRNHDLANALGIRRADDARAHNEAVRKENERTHKANEAIRRQSNGIAAGSLNLRRQEFEYRKKNGSGGGSKQPVKLRGKNGWYTKQMGKEERDAFYNQTYNEMRNRGLIDEGRVLSSLPADIFGRKSLSQSAIKQAVDNALMQHPEVGDWLSGEYEFDFDSRAGDNGTPLAPQPQTPFSAPWSSNRGNPFEERQQSTRNENHKSNPFG